MKNLRYLLILLLSVVIISCSEDEGEDFVTPVDPLDTQGNLLNGTWKVKDANSVTKDGSIVDVFTSMTLTISGGSASGGSYSTLTLTAVRSGLAQVLGRSRTETKTRF